MEGQDRRHREQMAKQARQYREQEKKHAEQMAVLVEQVKVRDAEMKRLIEVACDGAKRSSTAVASFKPFDSNLGLWLDYMEDSGLSSQQTPFLKRRELMCF